MSSKCSATTSARAFCAFALAGLLAACGGSDPQPSQTVIRVLSIPQCEPIAAGTMARVDATLANAGVEVRSKSCAQDGNPTAATCDVPLRLMHVIEVPQDQVPLTATLGYRPKIEFPVVLPLSCPAS